MLLAIAETHCERSDGEELGADGTDAPAFALDLGDYRVAAREVAIGVRFTCHNVFPAGEGSETRLYLLDLQGAAMREIFDEPIGWTNHDRVAGEDTEATGVSSFSNSTDMRGGSTSCSGRTSPHSNSVDVRSEKAGRIAAFRVAGRSLRPPMGLERDRFPPSGRSNE